MLLLTACDTKFDGRFVLNCGARHVICINTSQNKELGKVIGKFIEKLYENLVNKHSVCEAYRLARNSVEMLVYKFDLSKEEERGLFRMYTQE